ncbi:MAG: hypothetical protein IJX26_02430 [Clostridia bacterium]|nr:hypothetical protein [Clostridia bacterium]
MQDWEILKIVDEVKLKGGLTKEEQFEIFRKFDIKRKQGIPLEDIAERTILIIVNEKLIFFMLKKLKIDLPVDEAVSICKRALVVSVDKFDINTGNDFSTFACRCIRNELCMYFRDFENDKEKKLTVSLEDVIYKKVGDDDELRIEDTIKDEDVHYVEDIITKISFEQLIKFFKHLTEKEQTFLMNYFGLFGKERIYAGDYAKLLNVPISTIHGRYRLLKEKLKLLVANYENLSANEKERYKILIKKEYPLIEEIKFFQEKSMKNVD